MFILCAVAAVLCREQTAQNRADSNKQQAQPQHNLHTPLLPFHHLLRSLATAISTIALSTHPTPPHPSSRHTMLITEEPHEAESDQPSSASSSADKSLEHKECLTMSSPEQQQSEPDWLHIPLTSGDRSFDNAEQLFDVSYLIHPPSALHSRLSCQWLTRSRPACPVCCSLYDCQCVRDLHTAHDPEVTPYKSKYAARILLVSSLLAPRIHRIQTLRRMMRCTAISATSLTGACLTG